MAKAARAALTRIATTVTARFYPTSGATDGFYLDGRISGRREHRAADITLDREERGFFYAVYANLSSNGSDEADSQVRKSLDRIVTGIRQPGRNIDAEINDLAECAVSVVGRITLRHDGMRQPYFAGILVRDSEMAAVTMGSGCAYLYRNDVLYPLTADDYQLESIDYAGKPVSGLDVYCAGVAGTVRYSNIAQLQVDDCLIVCNQEVMESLGQREVLRMLYEAEDQADAAGLIMTAAAAKLPGTPMQFMIGFVESITAMDRTARVPVTPARGSLDTASVPIVTAPAKQASAGRGRPSAPSGPAAGPAPEDRPAQADFPGHPDDTLTDTAPVKKSFMPAGRQAADRQLPGYKSQQGSVAADEPAERDAFDEDSFGDEIDQYGRGRRIAFYIIIAAICVGCIFLIYNMLFGGSDDPVVTTTSASQTQSAAATPTPTSTTGTTGETSASETSATDATTEPTTTTSQTTTTAAPTTTASYEIETVHTVVANDTLWGIAVKYYGSGAQENIDLIKAANGMTSDIIKVGMELKIPVKPD